MADPHGEDISTSAAAANLVAAGRKSVAETVRAKSGSEPFATAAAEVEDRSIALVIGFNQRFPHLSRGVRWRNTALVGARPVVGVPDTSRLQSVNMVPFVGDRVLVITLDDGHIMLPGGTREHGESLLQTITREMQEETGHAIHSCYPFLVMENISYDDRPWRPWLPHPEFERLVCLGDVYHVSAPENPEGAEQIAHIHRFTPDEAVRFLEDAGRPEIGEVYAFAADMREHTGQLIDLVVRDIPFGQ